MQHKNEILLNQNLTKKLSILESRIQNSPETNLEILKEEKKKAEIKVEIKFMKKFETFKNNLQDELQNAK